MHKNKFFDQIVLLPKTHHPPLSVTLRWMVRTSWLWATAGAITLSVLQFQGYFG